MAQQFWAIRQNPRGNTNQLDVRKMIISHSIVTCPFGHLSPERNNVIDEIYNDNAHSQDKKFIENMNIGDIILIMFKGFGDSCIKARIMSDPIYAIDTKLFTLEKNGEIQISHKKKHNAIPFRPVGRKIQIICKNYEFGGYKQPQTLSKIKKDILFS